MKEPVELRDDMTRSLRMLGRVLPPEGMEARIALRMRERRAELAERSGIRRNSLLTRWAFSFAFAVAGAVVLTLSWHHSHVASPRQIVAVPTPLISTTIARTGVPVRVVRARRLRVIRNPMLSDESSTSFRNPPPLPLTHQEKLLLVLAHTPRLIPWPALASMTTSETVVDHGLGENAIFELSHQELTPLKTTLPGDNE